MDEKGVYAIARSLWSDVDFAPEPYTEREAWIWLVGAAAWKPMRTRGNTKALIDIERGEFSFALSFLMVKWQWPNKDKVHRFLKRLEKRNMMRDTSRNGSQVYSINKYNDFQVVGVPKRNAERTVDATPVQRPCNKEETLKHSNIEEEKKPPAVAAVVASLPLWLDREVWTAFLDMRKRKRAPVTDRAVRNILTKLDLWRQGGHDPTAILDASISNAWTDIYEPKELKNGTGSNQRRATSTDQHLAGIAALAGDLRSQRARGGTGS